MKYLSRILALTIMFLAPVLRHPMLTVLVSVLPVSFIVTFQLIGGAELSRHALYGALVVFSSNVGIISMPQIAVSYQTHRLRDIFIASPVSPGIYAAGMGLSRLLWALPVITIILSYLIATDGLAPEQLPSVALVILFVWLTGVSIGFALSTYFPDPYMMGNIANFSGMLLSVLPPVYYPLELVPEGWRWLPLLLPTTNAAQLLRIAGGLAESSGMVVFHWGVLVTYAVVFGALTVRKARWQER